jgi:multidrug efflux pump subunit AcrB
MEFFNMSLNNLSLLIIFSLGILVWNQNVMIKKLNRIERRIAKEPTYQDMP